VTERSFPTTIDAAVTVGDLSDLTTEQRAQYYQSVSHSIGFSGKPMGLEW
jgi:hypothetical protein